MIVQETKKQYYVFSPWLRTFHWIMVLSIAILFSTGLYMGNPGFGGFAGISPTIQVGNWFSMEMIRRVHFVVGWIFISAMILRAYGYFKNPGDRLFPYFWKKRYYESLAWTLRHYLFLPQKTEKSYLRNGLARTAYILLYFLIWTEMITGAAMFAMIRPNSFLAKILTPIVNAMGEYDVHLVHHYIAWIIIVFVIIHIYMVFREDMFAHNAEASSMINGHKEYFEDPIDVKDIENNDFWY